MAVLQWFSACLCLCIVRPVRSSVCCLDVIPVHMSVCASGYAVCCLYEILRKRCFYLIAAFNWMTTGLILERWHDMRLIFSRTQNKLTTREKYSEFVPC